MSNGIILAGLQLLSIYSQICGEKHFDSTVKVLVSNESPSYGL